MTMAYKRQSPQPVIEGGSSIQSATSYGPIGGGSTSTGAFQSISPGTSGFILKSNGSSALPSFQSNGGSGTNYLPLYNQKTFTNSRQILVAGDTSSTTHQKVTYLLQLSLVLTPSNNGSFIQLYTSNDGVSAVSWNYIQGLSYPYNSATPTAYSFDEIIGVLSAGVTYNFEANIWLFNIYRIGIAGQFNSLPGAVGRYTCNGSDGSSLFGQIIGQNDVGGGANYWFGIGSNLGAAGQFMSGTMTTWALREY